MVCGLKKCLFSPLICDYDSEWPNSLRGCWLNHQPIQKTSGFCGIFWYYIYTYVYTYVYIHIFIPLMISLSYPQALWLPPAPAARSRSTTCCQGESSMVRGVVSRHGLAVHVPWFDRSHRRPPKIGAVFFEHVLEHPFGGVLPSGNLT